MAFKKKKSFNAEVRKGFAEEMRIVGDFFLKDFLKNKKPGFFRKNSGFKIFTSH